MANKIATATATATLAFSTAPWQSCTQPNPQSKCPKQSQKPISRRHFATYALSTISLPLLLPTSATSHEQCCNRNASKLSNLSQEWFANDMKTLTVEYERGLTTRKTHLFEMITTTQASKTPVIVDIGIGTAPNLKYFPPAAKVIGIEPNPYMWPYAQKEALQSDMNLNLLNASCEHMPLQTASCDAVVTTTTLCSVTDVQKSLDEIDRILKPGGLYIFIEHVLAQPSRPLLRTMQNLLTPLQAALADGCHLNRDTGQCITSKFQHNCEEIQMDYFDACFNNALEDAISPIRPHISGYVRKQMF